MSELRPESPFREAMRAAEEQAVAEQVGVDPEQPRNPDGTFASPQAAEPTPESDVPPPDPTEPVAEPTPTEKLYAGKYKSDEDLERAYIELQSRLGRRDEELAEARELKAAFEEMRTQVAAPQRVQITADLIEQNPAAAAHLALEQGDGHTLQTAIDVWKEVDPAAAGAWVATKQAEQREAAMKAEYEARFAQYEQRLGKADEFATQSELAQAAATLPPDTAQFLESPRVGPLIQEFPALGNSLANGSPQEQVGAIKALYEIDRGRASDTLRQTQTEVARTQAEQAQAVRDESFVASQAAASADEPKTFEQIEQERAIAAFTRKRDNWNGAFVRPGK